MFSLHIGLKQSFQYTILNKFIPALFLTLMLFFFELGCNSSQERQIHKTLPSNRLKQFEWLTGTWVREDEYFKSVEHWSYEKALNNDTVLLGYSVQTEGNDTITDETLSIRMLNDTLHYIAIPGLCMPTLFKITEIKDRSFTAENPNHDFPQRIVYDSPGPSTLKATVSGIIKGDLKEINFSWKKKAES